MRIAKTYIEPIPSLHNMARHATARKTLGLSQRKMAGRLGVDPATLMGWEAGRHQPTKKSIALIGRMIEIL
jgi:DNA-binding transcriptional regulator YiaG